MITDEGKLHIKRYLAEYEKEVATSISFGIGDTAETSSDITLDFEISRSPIVLKSFDFVNDTLSFKSVMPEEFEGTVYEIGLQVDESIIDDSESRIISSFDAEEEYWEDLDSGDEATYVDTNVRVDEEGISMTPAASTTQTVIRTDDPEDLSEYAGVEEFLLAIYVGNANTTTLDLEFRNDSSNYHSFQWTTEVTTSGYKVLRATKDSASITGAPEWEEVNELRIAVTSGAGGASDVMLDCLRINELSAIESPSILIARKVLSVPFTKTPGASQEIEYSLDVTL